MSVVNEWLDEDLSDTEDPEIEDCFAIESEHDSIRSERGNFRRGIRQRKTILDNFTLEKMDSGGQPKHFTVETLTQRHNIIVQLPSLTNRARALGTKVEPIDSWGLLFDDDVLKRIIDFTNLKLRKEMGRQKPRLNRHV